MTDLIVIAVIIVILTLAIMYIVKAKKKGAKCIGCSESSCESKTSCSCNSTEEK